MESNTRMYVSCIQRDTGRKDNSGESLKHVPYMVSYMRDGNGGCKELKKAVAAEGYELAGTVVENESEARAHKSRWQAVNIRKWSKQTTIVDINKELNMKVPSFMDVISYLIKMKFISKESALSSGSFFYTSYRKK